MMKIGHRGAADLEPENTLLGIKRAIELGMDAVEVDVRKTKDNHLVVIHDEKVDRTTDGKGYVCEMTLEQIQKLKSGKGERIPTIQQVIDAVKGKCKLIIELKEHTTEIAVAEIIKKNKLEEECYVISFHHPIIRMIKSYCPELHTGLLFVGEPVEPVKVAEEANSEALFPNYKFLTNQMTSKLHNAGMKIFVWNCDTKEDIECMKKAGVDGISSNRPDLLAEVLG
ncbi:glycerophosphodiester phosphodiesterase [Candidatus Woesearchaeota archaeon]|nr:glycerophosphodiester phosphodiesterase [Candidatus Woesearchaeota archaeon]